MLQIGEVIRAQSSGGFRFCCVGGARRISRGRLNGILLWSEENFKRVPTWFFIAGWEEFQEGACMVFDRGVRRISRGHLHGFWLWTRRISRGRLCGFRLWARRISRGRLYGFWSRGEENFKRAPAWFLIVSEENFKRAPVWFSIVGEKNFKRAPDIWLLSRTRRIPRRHLTGFW